MNAEQWMSVIGEAYKSSGHLLPEEEKELLLLSKSSSEYYSEEHIKVLSEMYDVIWVLFWEKVKGGESFGDLSRIEKEYGMTLEERYKLYDGPFLNLAKTYWTFKSEIGDLFEGPILYAGMIESAEEEDDDGFYNFINQAIEKTKAFMLVLSQVECDIASVFFPMPGPAHVPVVQRRDKQREIIEKYAPQIDIERFLSENPILKADEAFEAQSSAGCFSVFCLLLLIGVSGLLMVVSL
ncbi:hypothetical protein ACFL6K_04010 [Candidatus Latescibacterota bacterium]